MPSYYFVVFAGEDAITPTICLDCCDVNDAHAIMAAQAIDQAGITNGAPGRLCVLDANHRTIDEIALPASGGLR